MLLNYEDVAKYLLDRQWIDPLCIVEGHLTIENASRRNSNFRITQDPGLNYFLKQEV